MQLLKRLAKGILPTTKRPRTFRKPLWGESEKQLVLKLRRENPTYGKAKIAVLLRRDHGLSLSESTVGRIIKSFQEKGLTQISPSASRPRRDILADSIGALRFDLKKALHKYNTYRPHFALKGLTPFEYINSILKVPA